MGGIEQFLRAEKITTRSAVCVSWCCESCQWRNKYAFKGKDRIRAWARVKCGRCLAEHQLSLTQDLEVSSSPSKAEEIRPTREASDAE